MNSVNRVCHISGDCVLTIGNFDGMHRGHQRVIKHTLACANELGAKSVAISFYPYPIQVLRPEAYLGMLMDGKEKESFLLNMGIDCVQMLDPTVELLSLNAVDFLLRLIEVYRVKAIVVGENFRFGSGAIGDINLLRRFCVEHAIQLTVVPLLTELGENSQISSTKIRSYLAIGDMERVTIDLGRYWSIAGEVVHGAERGRLLGFPTVNLAIPNRRVVPRSGVYATILLYEKKYYRGVTNVGTNPTFAETQKRIETHIFDFSEMIYGNDIRVFFVEYLRDEKRFKSAESLCQQIDADKKKVESILLNSNIDELCKIWE